MAPLGGYLTVTFNWHQSLREARSLGFLASYFLVDDPAYLKRERRLRRHPLNFDYIGLSLLVLVVWIGK